MSEDQLTPEQPRIVPSKSAGETTSPTHKILIIINALLGIGLIVIYILFFTGNKSGNQNPAATPVSIEQNIGGLKIAYVNMDSILANYVYAKDAEKSIINFRSTLEKNFTSKGEKLQKDYQDYLNIGATLTLTEQNKREESLKNRELELRQLEMSLTNQIQVNQIQETTNVLNAIYAFIKDYNEKNQQFNIILKKSFADGPVLYINEGMDITQEIMNGLNTEYRDLQEKKK